MTRGDREAARRRRDARRIRGGRRRPRSCASADRGRRRRVTARRRTDRGARDRRRGGARSTRSTRSRGRRPRHPRAHRLHQRGVPAVVRPTGALDRIRWSTVTLARHGGARPARGSCARTARAVRRRPPGEVLGEIVSDMLLRGPITRFADSRDRTPRRRRTCTSSAGAAPSTGWARRTRWSSASSSTASRHRMPSRSAARMLRRTSRSHAPRVGVVRRRRRPGLGAMVGPPPGAGVRCRRRPHRLRPARGRARGAPDAVVSSAP